MILMVQQMDRVGVAGDGMRATKKVYFDNVDNISQDAPQDAAIALEKLRSRPRTHLFAGFGPAIVLHCSRRDEGEGSFRVILSAPHVAFLCDDHGQTFEVIRPPEHDLPAVPAVVHAELLVKAYDLIVWMSGADDFGPSGEANDRWIASAEDRRQIAEAVAKAKL